MKNFIKTSRIILSVVLFSTISISGFSQMSVGGKVGYTHGNFAQDASPVFQGKAGWAVGGFFHMDMEDLVGLDFLSVNADLMYMRQGASDVTQNLVYPPQLTNFYATEGEYGISTVDVSLHTFELPISVNVVAPGFDEDVKPYATVGYSLGLITGAYAHTDYIFVQEINDNSAPGGTAQYSIAIEGKDNIRSNYKYWNNSFVIGGGIQLKGGDLPMFMDVKYFMGMNDIDNIGFANYNTLDGDTDYSKNTLLLTVGMGIDL